VAKPQNVRKLQVMAEMEKFIIAGHSHSEIREWLHLPRATYFRYLRQLFKEDTEILQAKREEDVLTVYAVIKGRLSQIYIDAYKIINSDTATNQEKLKAMDFAAQIAVFLTRVDLEAPTRLAWNKEQAQRTGDLPIPADIIMERDIDGNMVAITSDEQHQAFWARQKKEEEARRQKRVPLFLPGYNQTQKELEQKAREIEESRKKVPTSALQEEEEEAISNEEDQEETRRNSVIW
jgi:hypothetical protein